MFHNSVWMPDVQLSFTEYRVFPFVVSLEMIMVYNSARCSATPFLEYRVLFWRTGGSDGFIFLPGVQLIFSSGFSFTQGQNPQRRDRVQGVFSFL